MGNKYVYEKTGHDTRDLRHVLYSLLSIRASDPDARREYDERDFETYLSSLNLRARTVSGIIQRVNHFLKTYEPTAENFAKHVASYKNPNSHDNAEKAMRHLARFLGIQYEGTMLNARPKELLIAPSDNEVKTFLSGIDRKDIWLYLALLATTLIRPERLWLLQWNEIKDGFILIEENVRTKKYRPNPIHPTLHEVMERMKGHGRVFPMSTYTTLRRKMKKAEMATGIHLTRAKLRDYAYNTMRKSGVDRDVVDWLAGHSLGIRAHYLADTIKDEYQKFVTYTEKIGLLG